VFGSNITVIEAPKRVDLVMQLLDRLKPQVVVSALADFEMKSSAAFERLLDTCARIGARLLVDISDHIDLSSLPGTNGVLQYLSSHALPTHATIVCGLLKNKVSLIEAIETLYHEETFF
jgi:methionine S-methyltransferase